MFGDSIAFSSSDLVNGWVQRLASFLGMKNLSGDDYYCLYNLAVPGNTTEDLLKRFNFEVKQRFSEDEEVIIIFAIGINDSQFLRSQNDNRISLKELSGNVEKLIASAKGFSSKIVFLGLTPVDELKTIPIPWNKDKSYKNEYIKRYDSVIKNICKREGVYFVDISSKISVGDFKNLLEDGLHPNLEGHRKIFEILKDFLIAQEII